MKYTKLFLIALLLSAPNAMAAKKLESSDDRIKTLVFDQSEVYRIVTRAGFQTTLEFNNDETIDTISIGDSIGWQLTPAGRRLFIKPLHKSGITNLSVITSRRSYHFELVATSSTSMNSNNSYVINFYYPDAGYAPTTQQIMPEEQTRGFLRPVSETPIPKLPTAPQYQIMPTPQINAPLPGEETYLAPNAPVAAQPLARPMVQPTIKPMQMPAAMAAPVPMPKFAPVPSARTGGAFNYNYTMSGPNSIAPLKIYDNGSSTYLQFSNPRFMPQIFVLGSDNKEYPLSVRSEDGMAVVDAIAPRLVVRNGNEVVNIFNENKAAGY